jgi:hypothetical protein
VGFRLFALRAARVLAHAHAHSHASRHTQHIRCDSRL